MNTTRSPVGIWKLGLAVVLTSAGISCAAADGADLVGGVADIDVILDYSPTMSDAGALLYLASHPAVDLLAVTMPGTGEADCEPGTRTTRALLTIAGKSDVPVGCGREQPLAGSRDWPAQWRLEANSWGDEVLAPVLAPAAIDAEQLLVETLGQASTPVTIVAVGPLTDLGAVLESHPELAPRVERIVIMGGAVAVPGNVDDSPAAEWNVYIDPEAARRVIRSRIPVTLVPLDATNKMPWTDRLVARLSTLDGRAARTVSEMIRTRESLAGFYLWDELAAIASVRPDVISVERRQVSIGDDGAIALDGSGATIDIAVSADAEAATTEYLRSLNGGYLPAITPLTTQGVEYLIAMNGAAARYAAAAEGVYSQVTSDVPRLFVSAFRDAVAGYFEEVGALTPPDDLAVEHDDYLSALDEVVERASRVLGVLDSAPDAGSEGLFERAVDDVGIDESFERVRQACLALQDYSFRRDGPRPCSAAVDE